MLLVYNPQNYGTYADKMIGHASGCARIALAKDISVWNGDILLVGPFERDASNQVINIVLDGLIAHNRIIRLEHCDHAQILGILKERNTTRVCIVGSSAQDDPAQISDTMSALENNDIHGFLAECLDERVSNQMHEMAA